jgi:multiple sugar transport system substrate-binding protein
VLTSAKLAQSAGSQYGLLFEQPSAYYELEPLIVSAGGGTGISGKTNLTAEVSNNGWTKALSWYGNLYSSGVAARGLADFQTNAAFQQGKSAFFVGGTYDISSFAKTSFDWGVAPLPYFDGGSKSTPTGSWSLGVNAASKHSSDATTFAQYLTLNTTGATLANKTAGNMPSNSAAQASYLNGLDSVAGTRSSGAKQIISYDITHTATARPVSVGYPQFEDAVNKAIGDIVNGTSVSSRLKELQSTITLDWQNLK